jgi:hypothetical protein
MVCSASNVSSCKLDDNEGMLPALQHRPSRDTSDSFVQCLDALVKLQHTIENRELTNSSPRLLTHIAFRSYAPMIFCN